MSTHSKYKTKQKDILISYLKTVPGVHITAREVCSYFAGQGASISQATVYRHLEELVDEGVVSKYTVDGNTSACFEYTGTEAHVHAEVCYHCKCVKCGKLIHLHCDEVGTLQNHLLAEHSFKMDPQRTVFYGLCGDCI